MNKGRYRRINRVIEIYSPNKKDDNASQGKTDFDYLMEDFHSKQDTVDESATMIENRTFEIASGGLVLSLTVLSFLSSKNKLPVGWEWISVLILSLFTISILLHYLSHFVSKHNAELLRDHVGNQIRSGANYNERNLNNVRIKQESFLRILNIVVPIILVASVIVLIVFTSFCITN